MSVSNHLSSRIQKLLALANSPNQHEAATAMRMAQNLMAEHGVSEMDLKLSEVVHDFLPSLRTTSRMDPGENIISDALSAAFNITVAWNAASGKNFGQFVIIGRKHEVELAIHFGTILFRNLLKARRAFSAEQGSNRRDFLDSFCVGWAKGVHEAVKKVGTHKNEVHYEYLKRKNGGDTEKVCAKEIKNKSMEATLLGFEEGKKQSLYHAAGSSVQEKLS